MSSLSAVVVFLSKRKGASYHLIILNSVEKVVQIQSYDRQSLDQALSDYEMYEKEAIEGEKIEPVLVAAGNIENVKKHHPSFSRHIRIFKESSRYH